jgi:uncharacterized protein YjbJ (UPF0337 family)
MTPACARIRGKSQTHSISTGGSLMNKEQVEGRKDEAKGKVKEEAGKLTGDKSTEYKGKAEKHSGKAEGKYGDVKDDVSKD